MISVVDQFNWIIDETCRSRKRFSDYFGKLTEGVNAIVCATNTNNVHMATENIVIEDVIVAIRRINR